MMPKGVEHKIPFVDGFRKGAVSTSVMPKGVEHAMERQNHGACRNVSTSVMPKGVEHTARASHAAWRVCGEYICDAERR